MTKRINKSKPEIKNDMAAQKNLSRQKDLARKIWPFVADQKTIYDAQTVVNALAGFIKAGIAERMTGLVVDNLVIDFSKEKKSALKDSVTMLHDAMLEENADELVAILERFGNGLGQFSSSKYMTNPMSVISMDDFIA